MKGKEEVDRIMAKLSYFLDELMGKEALLD